VDTLYLAPYLAYCGLKGVNRQTESQQNKGANTQGSISHRVGWPSAKPQQLVKMNKGV